MAVNREGKNAITHIKVIERFYNHNVTLLEVKIETGRTHQIRVHLSKIGYPIIGDEVYSNGKNEWGIHGQCLHAKSLKFKHPINNKEMYIEAELPEYFQEIIKNANNNHRKKKGNYNGRRKTTKYLANQGIGSRRKCEQYILEGKVTVNGKTIKELGTK